MSDFKYVIGTLAGIEEKPSGWMVAKVSMPGKQYPLKLETKKEEIIDQARAARGQTATWKYTEHESDTINERSGKPYINRHLEAVKVGEHLPAGYVADAGSTSTSSARGNDRSNGEGGDGEGLTKEEWLAKDRASDLRACIAIASAALQHTIPPDPGTAELNVFNERVLHLATAWRRVVTAERMDTPVPSEPPADPGGEERPPPPDDDIPF